MPSTPKPAGPRPDLAAVVLAGGVSARMGADKAFLPWEGAPLLRRQIEMTRAAGAIKVWISGRIGVDYAAFACPVVHDALEGAGPLAGLVAALRAVKGSHAWLLALAVDLPYMTREYLASLAAEAATTQLGVLPQRGPYFEPLAAIYPVEPALAAAEVQLTTSRFALQELAANLVAQGAAMARVITPVERMLFANWNDATGPHPAQAE